MADVANTISVGAVGSERRIVVDQGERIEDGRDKDGLGFNQNRQPKYNSGPQSQGHAGAGYEQEGQPGQKEKKKENFR